MLKENSSDRLKVTETEDIIICPKCSRKNDQHTERCIECNFPLRDTILMKVIPIKLLKRR